MIEKNETQIQTNFSDEFVLSCFHYYEENKEEVEAEKQNKKYKGNLRKENFYKTIIEKIKTDDRLNLGATTSFKKAIKLLTIEDKITFFGLPKHLINECYMFYCVQYCDDDMLFNCWLNHKIDYGELQQDCGN